MKNKNIIEILIVVAIVLIIGTSYMAIHQKKSDTAIMKQEQKVELQIHDIIKDSKNDKEFNYIKQKEQKDGTYKIDIINKKTNQSKPYYIVDLKSNDYVIHATGYMGKCPGETCENEQKNS